MKQEIIYDLPFSDYRAVKALNFSSLKHMDDCPATFNKKFNDEEDDDDSDADENGNLKGFVDDEEEDEEEEEEEEA